MTNSNLVSPRTNTPSNLSPLVCAFEMQEGYLRGSYACGIRTGGAALYAQALGRNASDAEARAAHIARVMNSHDALVAALEAVLQVACENGAEDSRYPADRAAIDQARAALAAARNP